MCVTTEGDYREPHTVCPCRSRGGDSQSPCALCGWRIKQQLLQIIVQVSRQKLGRKHNEKELVTSCWWEGAVFCSKHGNSITWRKSPTPSLHMIFIITLGDVIISRCVLVTSWLVAVRRTSGVNKFVRYPSSGLYCAWRCGLKVLEQAIRIVS